MEKWAEFQLRWMILQWEPTGSVLSFRLLLHRGLEKTLLCPYTESAGIMHHNTDTGENSGDRRFQATDQNQMPNDAGSRQTTSRDPTPW